MTAKTELIDGVLGNDKDRAISVSTKKEDALSKQTNSKRLSGGAAPARAPRGRPKKAEQVKDNKVDDNPDEEDDLDEFDLPGPENGMRSNSTSATAAQNVAKAPSSESKTVAATKAPRGRKKRMGETQNEQDDVVEASSNFGRTANAKKAAPPRPAKKSVQIADAKVDQSEAMDVDQDDDLAGEVQTTKDDVKASKSALSQETDPSTFRLGTGKAASKAKQRTPKDNDSPADDITRKFEALDVKYRHLRDVGLKEAEDNFARLQRTTDEQARAAEELIASLRADVARLTADQSKAASWQKRAEEADQRATTAEERRAAVEQTLARARTENKTLAAKLSASRSVSEQPPANGGRAGSASAQQASSTTATTQMDTQQRLVLKGELYSDLTGLIVRDVRRREQDGESEDVYDCIQTGRNGTLHFHLSLPTALPADTTYDDAEFAYTPFLDRARDRSLLELLPDYLTEEICFPRRQASKFYGRLVDVLSRKVEEPNEAHGAEAGAEITSMN